MNGLLRKPVSLHTKVCSTYLFRVFRGTEQHIMFSDGTTVSGKERLRYCTSGPQFSNWSSSKKGLKDHRFTNTVSMKRSVN